CHCRSFPSAPSCGHGRPAAAASAGCRPVQACMFMISWYAAITRLRTCVIASNCKLAFCIDTMTSARLTSGAPCSKRRARSAAVRCAEATSESELSSSFANPLACAASVPAVPAAARADSARIASSTCLIWTSLIVVSVLASGLPQRHRDPELAQARELVAERARADAEPLRRRLAAAALGAQRVEDQLAFRGPPRAVECARRPGARPRRGPPRGLDANIP